MTIVAIGLSNLKITGIQHCSSPTDIYRFSPSLVLINLDHHENSDNHDRDNRANHHAREQA